jgi:SAM-dependent methyltransferase
MLYTRQYRWLPFRPSAGGLPQGSCIVYAVFVFLQTKASPTVDATRVAVVEVQAGALDMLRSHLAPRGVHVFNNCDAVPRGVTFAVATLFHVMEHLDDPVHVMRQIYDRLQPGGKLIVEGEVNLRY